MTFMPLAVWPSLLALLAVLCWPSVHARAERPAARPPELSQAAGELTLRGHARFRFWGFEVYDASLWTGPSFDAASPHSQVLALELRYLRDFAGKDIAERSLKEMRRVDAINAEQEKRWLTEMQRVFPDIRKGDRLLGVQRPGQAAVFWFNGQLRGEVADPEFARRFFGIWLSPRTSEPALRQALLGMPP
jgi:hypothetical protein